MLEDAVNFFTLATKQAPGYLTAHQNLSTAYFYLGRYDNSAAVLADARKVAPENPEIEMLWQISMLHSLEGNLDYLPVALGKVEPLIGDPATSPELLFNAAQLLERAARHEDAMGVWRRLATMGPGIPSPDRDVVAIRLGRATRTAATALNPDQLLSQRFAGAGQSEVGSESLTFSLTLNGSALNRLGSLRQGTVNRYTSGGKELLRRTIPAPGPASSELLDCCGEPLLRQSTGLGEVWRYGDHWAFLVGDSKILEIWQSSN